MVLAITHTHPDHVNGLLSPDGRVHFPNFKAIVIAETAVDRLFAESSLARFLPLLKPVRHGDQVADRPTAVALPGYAPGHIGYAFDTGEDRFLFVGDIVHVPDLQFGNPGFATLFAAASTSTPVSEQNSRVDGAEQPSVRQQNGKGTGP